MGRRKREKGAFSGLWQGSARSGGEPLQHIQISRQRVGFKVDNIGKVNYNGKMSDSFRLRAGTGVAG